MNKITILLLLVLICSQQLCLKVNAIENKEAGYVQLSRREYEDMKKQSLSITNILQRLEELEQLYQQIKEIVIVINDTIKFIKRTFNLPDFSIVEDDFGDPRTFKHISGVVMNPGKIDFTAELYTAMTNFKDHGIKSLEMDIYYNKKLFILDHISSKQLDLRSLERIPVSKSQSGAKDRIRIPISDTLSKKIEFEVYLAPLSSKAISIGDKTKVRIVNYKRRSNNNNPKGAAQVIFELDQASDNAIVVSSKGN
jgi:hypothetical protein